mmetsp:Transcript_11202/g.45144  ORF Transcript_11202/g.45144 Transcript_11202/m.45144 type:complete len:231 (+) Transcript_11202:4216-4908(+)
MDHRRQGGRGGGQRADQARPVRQQAQGREGAGRAQAGPGGGSGHHRRERFRGRRCAGQEVGIRHQTRRSLRLLPQRLQQDVQRAAEQAQAAVRHRQGGGHRGWGEDRARVWGGRFGHRSQNWRNLQSRVSRGGFGSGGARRAVLHRARVLPRRHATHRPAHGPAQPFPGAPRPGLGRQTEPAQEHERRRRGCLRRGGSKGVEGPGAVPVRARGGDALARHRAPHRARRRG